MRRRWWVVLVAVLVAVGGAVAVSVAAIGVSPATHIVQVSTDGITSCAVVSDGTAECWGSNSFGQLGNGTTTDSSVPVQVENNAGTGPLQGATRISVASGTACALIADGTVRCWGSNFDAGLGNGSTTGPQTCPFDGSACSTLPVTVQNTSGTGQLTGAVDVSVSAAASECVALVNGNAACWGLTDLTGTGRTNGPKTCGNQFPRACTPLPLTVQNAKGSGPLTNVVEINTSSGFDCVRIVDSTVDCWGDNTFGELGNGTTTSSLLPVGVKNTTGTGSLNDVVALGAGGEAAHMCVRISNGTAQCWGNNFYGNLGDGTKSNGTQAHNSLLPVVVKNGAGNGPLMNVESLVLGEGDTCARVVNSTAQCWGHNNTGQLGNGTTTDSALPVVVKNSAGTSGLPGVQNLTAGSGDTCARLSTGLASCWGNNSNGQLGNGTTTNSALPVSVL